MSGRSRRRELGVLALFVAVAFVPAIVGARFVPGAWYQELAKPAWTPPGWLFGPVWTLLYLTIGVAAWLVWRRSGWRAAAPAWWAWSIQLLLNGAWSWIFFGLRAPGAALLDIVALAAAIVVTIALFRRLHPVGGLLLLPYLAWVSFATALNAAIWWLN